jgi:Zn-finger nucleic acid-binding protein
MQCPSCGGELVELDRSGVRIDACRQCRGVWLDRGELDRILERERKVIGAADEDDDSFMREVTGAGKSSSSKQSGYGLDSQTAERIYSDYRSHKQHKKKKRKSFLDELFD